MELKPVIIIHRITYLIIFVWDETSFDMSLRILGGPDSLKTF